jgi:hypothetical protein
MELMTGLNEANRVALILEGETMYPRANTYL